MPYDDDSTVAMSPIDDIPMAMSIEELAMPVDDKRGANTKLPWIIAIGVIVLLVLIVAGLFGTRWYFSDKAAPGVTIGQISVVGQDREQLTDTVNRAVTDSAITVDGGNGAEVKASLADLGVDVDVDATVDALLDAKSDTTATGWRALLDDIARLNPFTDATVGLVADYDEFTANTFLTDAFVSDDQKAVASTIAYNPDDGQFAVTVGRTGRAPKLDAVNTAVNAAIAAPGTEATVTIDYADVDMPVSEEAAQQAADDANRRLDNAIVLTNANDTTFEIPSDVIASWIKPTVDLDAGTITLQYDESAIKTYLASELPKQLNEEKVDQEDVVDNSGNVLVTRVHGVKGVAVKDTDTTAGQVLDALTTGDGGTIEVQSDVTDYETVQKKVEMRIVVDKWAQTATVYNQNTVVKTFPVCTGKPNSFSETDNGTFYIYLKYAVQDMTGSNEDGSKYLSKGVKWVSYFNGGEGFHTADWNYSGIASGNPAASGSHGCVNMYEADAKWVYDNCPEGTIVQVINSTNPSAAR